MFSKIINDTKDSNVITSQPESEIKRDEKGWPQTFIGSSRSYSQSPNGVGISSLKFVPSSVFSTLQSETEYKFKDVSVGLNYQLSRRSC